MGLIDWQNDDDYMSTKKFPNDPIDFILLAGVRDWDRDKTWKLMVARILIKKDSSEGTKYGL